MRKPVKIIRKSRLTQIGEQFRRGNCSYRAYRIVCDLMLAGFCLLFAASFASAQVPLLETHKPAIVVTQYSAESVHGPGWCKICHTRKDGRETNILENGEWKTVRVGQWKDTVKICFVFSDDVPSPEMPNENGNINYPQYRWTDRRGRVRYPARLVNGKYAAFVPQSVEELEAIVERSMNEADEPAKPSTTLGTPTEIRMIQAPVYYQYQQPVFRVRRWSR